MQSKVPDFRLPVTAATIKPMDDSATIESLQAKVASLSEELAQLRIEVEELRNEKADLEVLLEMTTEHSDNLEEELYAKVEATLRESEKRFRLIAETIPIPVIVSRVADSTILYANGPASKLVHLTTDTAVQRKVTEFYADLEDQKHIFTLLEAQGYVSNYEMQGKTETGEPLWLEVNVHKLTFNDEPCLLTALYDVTERKSAEQERIRLTRNLETSLQNQVELTRAYSRFVPSEILQFLEKESIVDLQLGEHTRQDMTVLFSDIRSFTTMSEQMTPQENFNFINSYLGRVSPIIRQNNGFIDKYIGDAIMALFPGKEFPGRADEALQAAIEMQKEVVLYNTHRAKSGYAPISIGIGLHTGSVMLGTVGEAERMEGTVISDAVNLASRLESLTKIYSVSIIISEHTLFRLERVMKYQFRFLDKVKVKGKKEPVSVFEIFEGYPPEVIALKLKTRTDFEKGLLHYHSEEFQNALVHFQKVLEVDPDDGAAHLYLQRANHYIEYGGTGQLGRYRSIDGEVAAIHHPPSCDIPRRVGSSPSASLCPHGFICTASLRSCSISCILAPRRNAVRRSISSSCSKQRRNRPSAVKRTRLQAAQKDCVTLLIKPIFPGAPAIRYVLAGSCASHWSRSNGPNASSIRF